MSIWDSIFQEILDSLVVRISACHVEGPGSIPGRGEHFFLVSLLHSTNFLLEKNTRRGWDSNPRGQSPLD